MNKSKYYKHPGFGQVYGELVSTPTGRLVWPFLAAPKDPLPPKEGYAPQPPKHEATLLLIKGDSEVENFIATMKEESKQMLPLFNQKNRAPLAEVFVMRDGNDFDVTKYPYYQDHWVITAKNQAKPDTVDAMVKKVDPANLLGGMLVKLAITPMVTKGGWSYKLNSVQLVKDDGARFGGGTRDYTQVFEAIEGATESDSTDSTEVVSVPAIEQAPQQPVQAELLPPTAAPTASKSKGLDRAALDRL